MGLLYNQGMENTLFGRSKIVLYAAVISLFAAGFFIRWIDLTNPPLDIHAWRQLRSATIARAMYYDMLPNIDPGLKGTANGLAVFNRLEPNITERIVALSYWLAGGEKLWLSRIWTAIFWAAGGLALFLLAARITNVDGAILALAFYLLTPFAVVQSRAFLPEPLTVMLTLWALYCAYRWTESSSWKWAIPAGLLTGLAVLAKIFALYPLGGALILLCLAAWGLRRTIQNLQTWSIAAFAILIPAVYYIFPDAGLGAGYLKTWTIPYLHRLVEFSFYIGWIHRLNSFFSLTIVLIAFCSILILPKTPRLMTLGLWLGYALYGLSIPSLIYSHEYYNLPLVPIVALSLAPIGALALGQLARQGKIWRFFFLGASLVAIGYALFLGRKAITAVNYRDEASRWQALAALLPGSKIIGLTEDYNMRLSYYGLKSVRQYPYSFDLDMVRLSGRSFDVNADNYDYFQSQVRDSQFFVITMMDELDKQPYLKKILTQRYPIYAQGDWYVIYDLRSPK